MEIVGQEAASAALEAQLARGGGSGSTLIAGPEGVGRFRLALEAARAILKSDKEAHADLTVLDPGEGIDGVRAAARKLARRPAEAPRQVLILRDLDRMSVAAHNALLKTLEEPPADAAVLVVAQSPDFLPEVFVSRCRLVRARPLSDAQVAAVLEIPEEQAADAEGSPGRALYQQETGAGEAAGILLDLLDREDPDPLARAEKLSRRNPGEESKARRRRMVEVLRVAAGRLRRRLPATRNVLRLVVEALGSVEANANPAFVFQELVLATRWKKETRG